MQVHDLRSALKLLGDMPGQLVSTDVEVDPAAELSGVYRYVGAGVPRIIWLPSCICLTPCPNLRHCSFQI